MSDAGLRSRPPEALTEEEAAAELAAAAGTDPLTGLGNRRRFEQVLAGHAAGPHPGAVAVLDLNDLKAINDALGHPAGDAALQLVARSLRPVSHAASAMAAAAAVPTIFQVIPVPPRLKSNARIRDLQARS